MIPQDEYERLCEAVGAETRLLYDLSFAVAKLLFDLDNIIAVAGCRFDKNNKYHIKEFVAKIKLLETYYESFIEPIILSECRAKSGRYDQHHESTNELIRLIMTYINHTSTYGDYAKVIQYLEKLPNGEVFSEDTLRRFGKGQ